MKRLVFLLVLAMISIVVLIGCYTIPDTRPILPQTRTIESFTSGIAITKSVGETMISRGSLIIYPGFEITVSIPPVPIGARWKCTSSSLLDGDLSYICNPIGAPNTQASRPVPYNSLAFKRSGEVIGIMNGGLLTKINIDPAKEKFIPMDIPSEGSYKHELIYNGKSKDTIRLSYREYANDMARPAFFQDLTYDLSESREIAFRDLRIEVLEATNSAIKFIVK